MLKQFSLIFIFIILLVQASQISAQTQSANAKDFLKKVCS